MMIEKKSLKPSRKIVPKIVASFKRDLLLRRKADLLGRSFFGINKIGTKKESLNLYCRRNIDFKLCDQLTDSELIKVIQKENSEAYSELFARYQKKLFTYIFHLVGNRDETEDILQNVFSKTYKHIASFDTTRKFSSWIYRIAHNEAVNYLKRKSRRYTISWDDVTTSKDKLDSASNEEKPEDIFLHKEITQEIDLALEKLPTKYQQILKMRYFEDQSYESISQKLKKPINTVGTLINRAKCKLLEVVKKQRNK